MAAIDEIPEPTDHEHTVFTTWWERGGHPPHRRVWRGGVDVTDEDPATWPALWNPNLTTPRSTRHGRSPRK